MEDDVMTADEARGLLDDREVQACDYTGTTERALRAVIATHAELAEARRIGEGWREEMAHYRAMVHDAQRAMLAGAKREGG